MRSGLAIEILIWSKLCGPETWPKMFINSFMNDPSCGKSDIPCRCRSVAALLELDIEAERAELLHQDVEGFRYAGLEIIVAADNRLVDLGAAGDVVRLDGEHFLKRVGGAVSLERPHFHFAEALPAELRLAAQRLLGDEAIGPDRARVDLVVHQVMQLHHVDVADRHPAIELLAGAPVMQRDLPGMVETGEIEHALDVRFLRTVE